MSVSLAKSEYFVRPGLCGLNGCTIAHPAKRTASLWRGHSDQYVAKCDQPYVYDVWMVSARPVK